MKRFLVLLGYALISFSTAFSFTVTDKPEGWASQSGGTSGGAGGTTVTVSGMSQLQSEAKSSGKKIIIISKGTYSGALSVGSNKTIVGKEPGVTIKGRVSISNVSNVILRNFAVQGEKCSSYEECKGGADAVGILNNAHHVWLDHLDISDGQDGNCDITKGADFVTVSWCKFWYSYAKEHRFSNLISSADNVAGDKGKLNITYAYCWWADRVDQRQPRGRSGKVHVVNNLYTSKNASYACGPGVEIQMLIENNLFNNSGKAIEIFNGSPKPAFKSVGNLGSATNINTNQGTVFTPPYTLSLKMSASEVESKVKPSAGNTLTLGTTGTLEKLATDSDKSNPFIAVGKNGWTLVNPSSRLLSYCVLTLNGKIVLPYSTLKAGKRCMLPQASVPLFVRVKGNGICSDMYIPD
ncbi:MAG: polysaccharide lyase family 1 protein [Chitinispirillaceae bacterium]|nr:polysaccharide lyase family 1 protein [Chitinispirillaceae bacterium]